MAQADSSDAQVILAQRALKGLHVSQHNTGSSFKRCRQLEDDDDYHHPQAAGSSDFDRPHVARRRVHESIEPQHVCLDGTQFCDIRSDQEDTPVPSEVAPQVFRSGRRSVAGGA